MDPCHDRREGAQVRPGMANSDYTKCTQRLDRAYISNRWRCYHLVVAASPGDVEIEEESSIPPPTKQDTSEGRWRSGADTPNRNPRQRMVRHRPPRPAPPRFQGRMYLKRERTVSGKLIRREMPLQREQPKTIVKDQSLERRQVTEDHPSKMSHGKKNSSPPT